MRKATPYLLFLPAFTLLIIFKVFPIFNSLVGSLFTRGVGLQTIFVGLENYRHLFSSTMFWDSLGVTAVFNLFVVPAQIIFAIILALILRKSIRAGIVFRSIFFINVGVSLSAASVIWGIMLDSNTGVINSILTAVGLTAQPFLTSRHQALACLILICTWKGFSYWMLILLAGLQGIPISVYEAATIDGANAAQTLTRITLPLMKRSISFCTVSATSINLMVFSPMYTLTNGGPNNSTKVLMYNAYLTNFQYANQGSAYAMIAVLMLISFVLMGIQLKSMHTSY